MFINLYYSPTGFLRQRKLFEKLKQPVESRFEIIQRNIECGKLFHDAGEPLLIRLGKHGGFYFIQTCETSAERVQKDEYCRAGARGVAPVREFKIAEKLRNSFGQNNALIKKFFKLKCGPEKIGYLARSGDALFQHTVKHLSLGFTVCFHFKIIDCLKQRIHDGISVHNKNLPTCRSYLSKDH